MAISPRAFIIAATLCLAACKPAQPPDEASSAPTTASEFSAPATAAEATTSAQAPVATPVPSAAPDDLFVGWYFERDGVGLLQACGESVPLQVADPSFLRDLKRKLGGRAQPVYVRLRVRLAAGSKLEIADVEQFGSDETPIQDCVLTSTGT